MSEEEKSKAAEQAEIPAKEATPTDAVSHAQAERDNIYDRYKGNELMEITGADSVEVVSEDQPPDEKPEEKPEEKADTKADAPPEEEASAPEGEKEVEQTKDKKGHENEERMVNYGALHAEREERKKAQAQVVELETRVAALTAQEKAEEEDAPIEDAEAELKALRGKVAALEAKDTERTTGEESTARQETKDQFNTAMNDVDEQLSKEGLPGFKFLQDAVGREVLKQVEADPENRLVYDAPDNYKKIYREIIYPQINGVFVTEEKKTLFEQKEALKDKANLVKSPGKPPQTPDPESDEPKSSKEKFDDYMKFRKNSAV